MKLALATLPYLHVLNTNPFCYKNQKYQIVFYSKTRIVSDKETYIEHRAITMFVYNYHPDTKVFTYQEPADPDPEENGRYLLPAHATFVPIPTSTIDNQEYEYVWNEKEDKWDIREKPKIPLEVVWTKIRMERNRLLYETDWMFTVRDYTMTPEKETAWRRYRQELRDLPQTISDPYNTVGWPTKPSAL